MRPVVGIFAHPDDEIFAGGTLATFAQERDVYLVCVTNGEAGMNSSQKLQDLGAIRREELLASAKSLGVKKVFFLEFKDGELNNNSYSKIADKLLETLTPIDPGILLTFEPRGVSGHIDHVVTSMVTTYVFEKLKNASELWYYCFDEEERKTFKEYFENFFVFIPPGYNKSEITKTVNAAPLWQTKLQAMHQHVSQQHDIEKLEAIFTKQKKEEYFLVINKDTE